LYTRVLHVSLGEISETAEEMILELRELRSFDFHGSKLAVTKLERDVKLMAKLLCGLPKLQELWPSYPVRCQHSKALNWLLENEIRVPIGLRKLRLDGETHYPLDLVQRVESLYLMGSKENYGIALCRSIKYELFFLKQIHYAYILLENIQKLNLSNFKYLLKFIIFPSCLSSLFLCGFTRIVWY
jgi:hypothetical protein